jgi:hydrogenase nickel incorporation protein HypA/HybF
VHEVSIAMRLVEIACEQLPRLGAGARIAALHVRIGPLAAVGSDALRFSFGAAAAGTAVAGARLEIEEVALIAWCDRCAGERRIDSMQLLQCPDCGAPTPRILTGRELELAALEVLDDGPNR